MKFFNRGGILVLGFLMLATCPLALAGPNCDKNPDHPACSDGGGDGGGGGGGKIPVTLVDNLAAYHGSVSEIEARFCPSELVKASRTARYECEPGGTVFVEANLGWATSGSNEEQGYCDLLNVSDPRLHHFTPTRYWYRNIGGCDFDNHICNIEVSMISYRDDTLPSHEWINLPNPLEDIGKISIVGHGVLKAIDGEGNVFSIDQVLSIDDMSIMFFAAGTNTVLANCVISEVPKPITFKTWIIP